MNRRFVLVASLAFAAAVVALFFILAPSRPPRPAPSSTSAKTETPSRPAPSPPSPDDSGPAYASTPTPVPPALADELARLLAIADPDERFGRLDRFWRHWFATDREGLFAAIAGLPAGDERAQALAYALLELARTDPDRALDLALELVRDEQDAHLFASLFDTFAQANLDHARERLARVPPGLAFAPAWRAFTDAYARINLAAALSWARSLDDDAARSLALETALYTLAEKDAFTAFEMALAGLTGDARDRALYQALRQIIPHDPAAASALIGGMPPSPQRELAVVEAARVWADADPGRALAWALALPEEDSASTALAVANILEIWATKDASAASLAVAGL
ncbi:MAG: hypothetical protein H7067_00020, partial [Burkholderiales bacterium]|nr:hypothetical protein [Opitutaceae bacterium]